MCTLDYNMNIYEIIWNSSNSVYNIEVDMQRINDFSPSNVYSIHILIVSTSVELITIRTKFYKLANLKKFISLIGPESVIFNIAFTNVSYIVI